MRHDPVSGCGAAHDPARCRERRPWWKTVRRVPVSETNLNTPRKIRLRRGRGSRHRSRPDDRSCDRRHLAAGRGGSGAGTLLGRCFGVALLTLGLACWPTRQRAASDSPAFRAMLIYNVLIALYRLPGTVGHLGRAVVAGRCAARRRGAVAGLDVARRATDPIRRWGI
jgi:hypothetical protein